MNILKCTFIAAVAIISTKVAAMSLGSKKLAVSLGFKSPQTPEEETLHGLPKIVVPDFEKTLATKSRSNMSRITEDILLQNEFPGQFFTPEQIKAMDKVLNQVNQISSERKKRTLDTDICCRTNLWFGPAPEAMKDWRGEGPFTFLKGSQTFQAYARGDCGQNNPQPNCPAGGTCLQKQRLHLLWVESRTASDKAELKYFYINNHCAYESLTYADTTGGVLDIRLPVAQALTGGLPVDGSAPDSPPIRYPSFPGLP